MSTGPLDGHRDSRVVPLRAVGAQTEVRLDEDQAPGPSYVDLTGGEAKRRPIIPDHWASWENAKRHITLDGRPPRAPGRLPRRPLTRLLRQVDSGSRSGAWSPSSGAWSPGGTSRAPRDWSGMLPRTAS